MSVSLFCKSLCLVERPATIPERWEIWNDRDARRTISQRLCGNAFGKLGLDLFRQFLDPSGKGMNPRTVMLSCGLLIDECNNHPFKSAFTCAAIRPPGIVMYSLCALPREPEWEQTTTVISPNDDYVGLLWDAGGIFGYERSKCDLWDTKGKTGILHNYSGVYRGYLETITRVCVKADG